MELPKEFFTVQSMLTLTGATGATFVVVNGVQSAFNFNRKWFGLLVAEIISLFGVYAIGGSGTQYFVGFINGFLIYCTAGGATGLMGGGNRDALARGAATEGMAEQLPRRRFLSPWF